MPGVGLPIADNPSNTFIDDQTGVSDASLPEINSITDAMAHIAENARLDDAKALLHEHPDYIANIAKWSKYEDLYESQNLSHYIPQHPRESDDVYRARLSRVFYYNYCASVVDLYVAYLFSAPIDRQIIKEPIDSEENNGQSSAVKESERKSLSEDWEAIRTDADYRGTTYTTLMQHVATFAQIHGHCGVLVDAPRADEQVVTEQDRKDNNLRPYLMPVTATQIKDWDTDRFGRFNWVKIEIKPDEVRDFRTMSSDSIRHFVIWDRDGWEQWRLVDDRFAEIIASGESPPGIKGQVPLVIFPNTKNIFHEWMGSSAIKDISDINVRLMNWSTFGDEEIANRCLNILAMEQDDSGKTIENISHHNVLEYPNGADAPSYLTPGATPLQLIAEWIKDARNEIYRLAKLGGSTGLLGVREATSGIAYAFEFNETNQSLVKKAESMEQGEQQLLTLICAWLGKKFEGTVGYPREFGVDDFITELEILAQARSTLTSETAIKQIERNLASRMFARESMDFRRAVDKEINAEEAKPSLDMSFATADKGLVAGTTDAENADQNEDSGNTASE